MDEQTFWLTNLLPFARRTVEAAAESGALRTWSTKYIDYHPPIVARMWLDVTAYMSNGGEGAVRIMLHSILPVDGDVRSTRFTETEALYHPHPWPSAVEVLSGQYEHVVGTKETKTCTTHHGRGAKYTMLNPDAWHSVKPWGREPVLTCMIAGVPYEEAAEAPATSEVRGHQFRELTDMERIYMINRVKELVR